MSGSVLLGLNVTNHVSANCNILIRSALSRSAEATWSSTTIKRLAPSEDKRIQEPNSFTISFIKKQQKKQWAQYRTLWNTSKYF